MAQPKNLRTEALSLEDLWYELLYSEARLAYDETASDFTKETTELVDRAEQVRIGQLKAWRKEIIAQAHVDARNNSLDELTKAFEKHLYRHLEDSGVKEPTKDARYKTYFPETLSRTINLGLETQVQKTRHFVTALQTEEASALQAFSARFSQEFARDDIALKELSDAQVERRKFRSTEITALFDDANTSRQVIFGKLTTRAAEQRLGREWAETFFRHSSSSAEDPQELKRNAVLLALAARGIEVSKETKQRINNEENDAALLLWLSRAGTITEQAALFV